MFQQKLHSYPIKLILTDTKPYGEFNITSTDSKFAGGVDIKTIRINAVSSDSVDRVLDVEHTNGIDEMMLGSVNVPAGSTASLVLSDSTVLVGCYQGELPRIKFSVPALTAGKTVTVSAYIYYYSTI